MQVYDPTGTFSFSVSIFYFFLLVGEEMLMGKSPKQTFTILHYDKKEEKKRTLKGVVLTSFDSFSISDS
jgi:hypothetical protein